MKKRIFFAVGALALLATFAAACTESNSDSDLQGRVDSLEQQVDQLNSVVENESMLAALQALGAAGLHDIDEAANDNNEIPGGAAGPIDRAIIALAAAPWPADLQSQADALQQTLQTLLDALATEDVAQVKGPATAAHDSAHEFEEEVGAALKPALGLPADEPEKEEPATTGTPEAGATEESQ